MHARKCQPKDLQFVHKCLLKHGQNLQDWQAPKLGFIVPGVAAGFINQAENGAAIIDGLITNPLCSSMTRHKALEAVVSKLISVPGITKIYAFTAAEGTFERALQAGFQHMPDQKVLICHF